MTKNTSLDYNSNELVTNWSNGIAQVLAKINQEPNGSTIGNYHPFWGDSSAAKHVSITGRREGILFDYSFAYSYVGQDWIMRRDNQTGTWTAVVYMEGGTWAGQDSAFQSSSFLDLRWGTDPANIFDWVSVLEPDNFYTTAAAL